MAGLIRLEMKEARLIVAQTRGDMPETFGMVL